ncbi:MAG: 3-deoxy-D-manno-octulosonic acid transferase [Desulfobulbaceae bacterium]
MLLYRIYSTLGTLLFLLSYPVVKLAAAIAPDLTGDLGKRFGIGFKCPSRQNGYFRVWIHAASVGEVRAAGILIREIVSRENRCEIFLSTMTSQGRSVAGRSLPRNVFRFPAPLDAPCNVRRFLSAIKPDLYLCVETELWPAMFFELRRSRVPAFIVNGRLGPASFRRYLLVRGVMRRILENIYGLAVISEADGDRFIELGADPDAVQVTGNVKYDFPAADIASTRSAYRKLLGAEAETVLVCGSTRTGEEEQLLRLYEALRKDRGEGVVWVLAPRHLERLDEVRRLLNGAGLEFDHYSDLRIRERRKPVVLVDTMGDLADIYSAGDVNFVGGSLVPRRGHNIMEAARWERPVYYGPGIEDFRDAAEALEEAGGGFRVADVQELATLALRHLRDRAEYERACRGAAETVHRQRGAAARQAEMVLRQLSAREQPHVNG